MEILPDSVSLSSYFIVTAALCVVTYGVVFNLQLLTNFSRWCSRWFTGRAQASMQRDPDELWQGRASRLRQARANGRRDVPASNWLYLGYLLWYPFSRRPARPKAEGGEKGESHDNGV